jgi:hypothetical protein
MNHFLAPDSIEGGFVVKRTQFLITMGLAICLTTFAAASFAGPIITVSPTTAGPINCSDSTTFTVHYNPNDYVGELTSFEIVLANGAGDYAIFDDVDMSGDVQILDWTGSQLFIESDNPYELAVGGVVLGGDPLPAETEADLFEVTFHGDATGIGEFNLVEVTLNNGGATAEAWVNPLATVEVDCTPPDAPVMDPLLTYTGGTEVEASWSAVPDGFDYFVECDNGDNSGWITDLDYLFTGLVHNTTYGFRVMARDDVGNEGAWSDYVYTTMDNVTPESAAGPLDPAYNTWLFEVPYTASDDMSGVQYVELYYNVDGGPWMAFGTTFGGSPIAFEATEDGEYCFYTVATDNAGNVEVNPADDAVCTLVDTTPPDAPEMAAEPPFTPGTENTVSWGEVDDAVDYFVECDNGTDSGWTTDLEATFGGLADDTVYCFRVKARDSLLNEGDFSDWVCSEQDDTAPWSEIVDPPTGDMLTSEFDVVVDFGDDADGTSGSGVALIRLYYKLGAGTWTQFGAGFTSSPIPFVAPGDGELSLYTIAEDEVGNVEDAPPVPDVILNVDTAGPTGTFVINNDDEYTTGPSVTLYCDFTDPNGVVNMRFQNEGEPWSAWVPYEETYPWTLTTGDGTKTVYAEFEDGTTNVSGTSDTIILDTDAPLPISLAQPVAGHETITFTWTEDDAAGDLNCVEIWVQLWDDVQNDIGNSVYPEYNDEAWPSGAADPGDWPTVPWLDADGDWELLTCVTAGEQTYIHSEDSPWDRGAYLYVMFAKDNAGNYSAAHAQWPRRSVNYILGDFDGDGVIEIGADVTPFAVAYGADEGDPLYNNEFDIGPLSGGVPDTDNDIDFEDLMILAGNFNAQAGTKAATGDPETPVLTWYPVDELTWALGLVDPCNSLKGLRLAHALPENATVEISAGDALAGNIPHVLANDAGNGLDIGFAILGQNQVMPGNGEILRVTTSEPIDLSQISLKVRDAANEDLEYELTAEPLVVLPSVYKLADNYPNPFNPQTTIKFSLPEGQDVRLEIFDIKGHRVNVLVNEAMPAGNHSVVWTGRDRNGRMVASGTYFYRIQAGPLNETRRMLLVK